MIFVRDKNGFTKIDKQKVGFAPNVNTIFQNRRHTKNGIIDILTVVIVNTNFDHIFVMVVVVMRWCCGFAAIFIFILHIYVAVVVVVVVVAI